MTILSRYLRILSVLFIFTLLFTSCKKTEIQGPKGDPGDPGKGGNTNISSSVFFDIYSFQWAPTGSDSSLYQTQVNSSLITDDIYNKGTVKLFVKVGSDWNELPYIVGDLYTQFGFAVGVVKLKHSDMHGAKTSPPLNSSYRLVVLSGN